MILFYFFCIAIFLSATVFIFQSRTLFLLSGIAFIVVLAALSWFAFQNKGKMDTVYFHFDSISILLNILLTIITIPVLYHTRLYLRRHIEGLKSKGRFLALMFLLIAVINGIYFADNFMILWVCFELSTIFLTFLIFHERYIDALEAAWKYLFISSIGITLAFLGILFLSLQSTGGEELSLSYTHLLSVADKIDPFFLKSAFLLIITGLSIKINLFPLHAATIDAKTVAPFPVNAIASTALINGGFVAYFRMYSILTKTSSLVWAQHVLIIIGLISLFIVAIQLFKVKRFKRMFAFSSMEHMALIIIALSLGKPGYYAAILHLVFHTLIKTGLFLHFGIIRNIYQSGWIKETGEYFKNYGFNALIYILGILSITAIPPSGMFLSEFLIFKGLFSQNQYLIAMLIFLLLSTIIYLFFKNSMQLLYGKIESKEKKVNPSRYKLEALSQLGLFGLVVYLAYFPPAFFSELLLAVVEMLN